MWDECEIPGVCWRPQDTRSARRSSASGFCVKSCLLLRCCSRKCPLQGISVSEGSSVFLSTGSAAGQRFAWITKGGLKHILESLVVFFKILCWGLTEQNTKQCCSVVMPKPPHLYPNSQEPLTSSCFPFPPVALCKAILCLAVC